jgi:hypothetical protein
MNRYELRNKLKTITKKQIIFQIYEILKKDKNFKYTISEKGLLFDINLLKLDTLEQIENIINDDTYYIDNFDNLILEKLLIKL